MSFFSSQLLLLLFWKRQHIPLFRRFRKLSADRRPWRPFLPIPVPTSGAFGKMQGTPCFLHVGTHQSSGGIVVVKKRNHAGGHAISLIGRHIHKMNIILATNPGWDIILASTSSSKISPGFWSCQFQRCAMLYLDSSSALR